MVTAPDLNGNISKFSLMLNFWALGPVFYLCHHWNKSTSLCCRPITYQVPWAEMYQAP